MRKTGLLLALLAGCGGDPFGSIEEANTQYCPMPTIEGIDVYSGNGAVNWAKVKAAGRVFPLKTA